jgi:ABC-type polysaccharide/polyol phosphate export permease
MYAVPPAGRSSGAGAGSAYPSSMAVDVVTRKRIRRVVFARSDTDTVLALAAAALRARYGRGPYRLVKWLVDPFALLGVYLLLVTFVLDRPGRAPGLSIACAVVPFQFITATVTNSLSAVSLHRSIVLNMRFKRTLIPIAMTLTEVAGFIAALSMIVLTMVAYRVAPTAAVAWLPVLLAQCALFALALSYPATLFGLYFRDLRSFALSAIRALFFLSAGLIPLASVHGNAPTVLKLNPLTGLFESFRAVFLFGKSPSAWNLLYPAGIAVLLLVLVVPAYVREAPQFAKVVE